MASFSKKMRNAYNAFATPQTTSSELTPEVFGSTSYGVRPDRTRNASGTMGERSIITAIYTRIGIDIASIQMRHVRLDDQERFKDNIDSGLNNCLTVEANIDQASRDFRQDIAMTLCSEGFLAIVPVDTSLNPAQSSSYDILTMRVGKIVAWHPRHVRVSLYNDRNGQRQEIMVSKENVAIVTNPLYAIMNEPNSTLQRLVRKLNLLDSVDEASASGKLDLLIQLPYVIKSEARRQQAEQRRSDIEEQLRGSQYGIAYTDGTEKVTQLNRPAENNLMGQVTYLTTMLYGQLGITEEVLNGTADEKTMLNYWNRTIEPIVAAITESMHRTFLSKTARSQSQAIRFFRDPFRLVPIENIAEIADKFTRNEIMSSNEFRQVVGMSPSGDPKADQLVNSNMPQVEAPVVEGAVVEDDGTGEMVNGAMDSLNTKIDEMFAELGGED
ncbi:portal protein [Gordonia phage Gravy]|uniref:Portal protein n=3 Tax=Tanisvirus tanis TaxID=2844677 RepID=A0A7D5JPW7_9CAUD|nr:portal protein [Gordonia phage Gravy]AVO25351.1 portal protein [Gordonia phage Kerry]QLF83733.1 portal protein [Gordonia phage Magel]QYW00656.1 portal protein [Gordonia phage Roney]